MRSCFVLAGIVALTALVMAQETATSPKASAPQPFGSITTDPALKNMFEAKVRAEWEALKNMLLATACLSSPGMICRRACPQGVRQAAWIVRTTTGLKS